MSKLSKDTKQRIVISLTSESAGKELIDAIEGGRVLSGSEAPSDSLGENGDLYVNITNGDLYKKYNNSWSLQESGGGGDFANRDLSNLVAPTLIPDGVGLNSVSTTSFSISTSDSITTDPTGAIDINTGDINNVASSANTGIMGIRSGETNGSGNTGEVQIYSGNNNGTGSSGNIVISAGTTADDDKTTGSIEIRSGYPWGNSNSGSINIFSHNAQKRTGDVSLHSGNSTSVGDSGNIFIYSGNVTSGIRGSIDLNGQSTSVYLRNFDVTGYHSLFRISNNSPGSIGEMQFLTYARGNDTLGLRIFDSNSISGFSIDGWGRVNENGGPFNFMSTKASPTVDGTLTGGDFNIVSASTEYVDPSLGINASVNSGNVNISTANGYITGSNTDANTGDINLITGEPQGAGTRGVIVLDGHNIKFNTPNVLDQLVALDDDVSVKTNFHVFSPDLSNYSHIGLADPNNTFAYFGAIDNPFRNSNIGTWSSLGQSGGNVFFHGSIVRGTVDGTFKSTDVYLESRAESGYEETASNLEISSGNITVRSLNGFIKGTGANANSGNITIQTGTAQGTGTRGEIILSSRNIVFNTPSLNGRAVISDFGIDAVGNMKINALGYTNYSHMGFGSSGNFTFAYVGAVDGPTRNTHIGGYASTSQSGGNYVFHGSVVRGMADGTYKGANVYLESRSASGFDDTAANLEISSGDITVRSLNAFIKGTGANANTGNITLQTGAEQGSGTRGYISLDGDYVTASSTQIKDVADATDPNDAVNLSQLETITNDLEDRIVSLEDNSNVNTVYAYEDNLQVRADGQPGVKDPSPLIRDGWYYKNLVAGQKINWYYFDGLNQGTVTLGDLKSVYAVMTFDAVRVPILAIYTVPTGVGDALPPFAHSRIVYNATMTPTPVVGKKYLVYGGEEPSVHPELPRIELSLVPAQSIGEQLPAEQILTVSFGSDSGASVNSVQYMVETLGLFSDPVKHEMDLRIRVGSQLELDNKANRDLSNIITTSIPAGVNLESLATNVPGSANPTNSFTIRTKDQTSTTSGTMLIKTGDTSGNNKTGNMNLWTGDGGGTEPTGSIYVWAGYNNSTGAGGTIHIYSGDSLLGNSGNINIVTGSAGAIRGKVVITGREVDVSSVKIVNLANGTDPTDAINLSQLTTLQNKTIVGQFAMPLGADTFSVTGLNIGTTNYIVNITIENIIDATLRHLVATVTAKTSTSFDFTTPQTTDHVNYKANYIINKL